MGRSLRTHSSRAAGRATKYCPATGTAARNVETKTGTVMMLALNTEREMKSFYLSFESSRQNPFEKTQANFTRYPQKIQQAFHEKISVS